MVRYVDSKASSKHPVVLAAHLDPGLSRRRLFVKWFLAIPHSRPLFDFTGGVLRRSWRVSYCVADGGLGTGQYPSFRLHQEPEATLPARPPTGDPAMPLAPDPAGTRSVS